jgi:histidinol-phosphate/aromatic aminotransferase/cobyric acid decarboxylase-like protein
LCLSDLSSFGLPTCVRVTIGLPEQNTVFIHALEEVLNDGS